MLLLLLNELTKCIHTQTYKRNINRMRTSFVCCCCCCCSQMARRFCCAIWNQCARLYCVYVKWHTCELLNLNTNFNISIYHIFDINSLPSEMEWSNLHFNTSAHIAWKRHTLDAPRKTKHTVAREWLKVLTMKIPEIPRMFAVCAFYLFLFLFQLWFTRFMANCSFCLQMTHTYAANSLIYWVYHKFLAQCIVRHERSWLTHLRIIEISFSFDSDNLGNKRWIFGFECLCVCRIVLNIFNRSLSWIFVDAHFVFPGFEFVGKKWNDLFSITHVDRLNYCILSQLRINIA